MKMIKIIYVSSIKQRGGLLSKDDYNSAKTLVKETNPYFNWYKRAAIIGLYRIREEREIIDKTSKK